MTSSLADILIWYVVVTVGVVKLGWWAMEHFGAWAQRKQAEHALKTIEMFQRFSRRDNR